MLNKLFLLRCDHVGGGITIMSEAGTQVWKETLWTPVFNPTICDFVFRVDFCVSTAGCEYETFNHTICDFAFLTRISIWKLQIVGLRRVSQ